MAQVITVTGPMDAADLGRVLSHEHVVLGTNGLRTNYPDLLPDLQEIEEICVEKLSRVKAEGWDTLIDHTTFDIGRDVALLKRISERSGVRIVAATGIWMLAPRWFQKRPADQMVPLFTGDIQDGVAHTGIRAGIIKCALDRAGLEKPLEQILRACARAHIQTGVPISTHTFAEGRSGDIQQDIFAEEGVDLKRVLIGHSGDTENLDYLRGLMERGSFIGMDRFGIESTLSDDRRCAVVAKLAAEGYAQQMMLSHDSNSWSDRDLGTTPDPARKHWHYFNMTARILPRLRELGVSDEQIDQMTGSNVQRLFGG